MFVPIPGIVDFANYLITDEYNEIFPIVNIVLAVFFFFYRFKRPCPYGRLRPQNKKLGAEISPKLAFMIFNLIPFAVTLYFRAYYRYLFSEIPLINIPIIFWLTVYLFRGTIYALLRSKFSNPWPVKTVIYFLLMNISKSILFVRCITFQNWELKGAYKITLCVLWVIAFLFGAKYDIQLTLKRFKNAKGYKFMKGGIYNLITCPNYFFEFLMNLFLILMIDNDIYSVAVFIWMLPNVLTRAETLHYWSKKFHKPNYPKNRASFIPFIKFESVLEAFLTTLEYGGF
ncbi:3-oxo-5-alpha-steroid 4-dehydrogenase family protein [Trichomonas vaginalis G3]|uniref:3-oxo-5-alpha-steroid 4-dehydrogenase family protein n=1 Tax=Trichomonas vaginalis (strain ATCC PRA-98 / G3) TaxID=412133 RepID=A2F1V8_TRIV3|nr:3-oxo-5-alpha-steroid 4-dehydrogenase family [Trichomonas vaginalis G3]EAY01103.1 3-oxo-5-alpha-steroid 4-dehydrogenase family protein [Trichomonas vaginalis G3]KAI5517420.1 3-oxo-5-alpha-steroid 4-dehydrogenase family [Trichomonas vaginalis G3]|eukprot:XP_001313955.1 3-oxo-5-alpha-steroid 4-dehydrogenase family protein [Trichomonas vaginalis G3]